MLRKTFHQWRQQAVAICFFVLATLTCATIALQLGVWVHDETFTAPFPVSSSNTNIVPVWGGTESNFFWVRSDTDDRTSDLRAWIDGVELRPHLNITENMNGFSHWGHFVYFSKATGSKPASTLHIRYPIRLRPWVLYALIILLILFSWRTASSTSISYIIGGHTLFLLVLRTIIRLLALLALFAAASAIAGLAAGRTLYPLYAYQYLYTIWPGLKSLIWIEPYVPLALISLSLAIAASSWLLDSATCADQTDARLRERNTIDICLRWGLPAILGLLLTSVILGAWSGNVIQLDLPYMNVAGLVPNSDSKAYLAEALRLFHSGQSSQFGARRILATILLGWISFLAHGSYVTVVIIQSALVTIAIYVAAVAVMRWRGVAASICFVAFSYIIVRPFIITTLTETAAVSITFLAVPLFVYGLLWNSNARLLLGFFLINIAMLIRPGGILCLPAFVAWALLFSEGSILRRLKFASLSTAIGLGAFLLNTAITRFFCPDASSVEVAFPYVLCGLSLGTSYHLCEVRYVDQLSHLSEAAAAKFLYAIAWKNFLASPRLGVDAAWQNALQFLKDIPQLLFRGYYLWRLNTYFPILLVYGFSCFGWLLAGRRRLEWRLVTLVGLFFLGNLVSAAFLYNADGQRAFIVSYPLFAALIAGGLCSPRSVQIWRDTRLHSLRYIVVVMTLATAVLALGPAVIARYRLAAESTPAPPLSSGEVLINRQRPLVGFLVVPDSTQPSLNVPSIPFSLFREFLEAGQFLPQIPMEKFPKPPFGFIFPAQMPLHQASYENLIVPPEVILREDVPAWKLHTVPFNNTELWSRVTHVEPILKGQQ